ncbi:TetR/AcrR family transcriptional regulator [Nocardioides sp. LHD-245]|uniref:TetR/AcrR family transcriptional regulator n=1 Tax=Nocardioides sp. LHD-245 TaxID=3051387 RepID=UPI0027E19620|nr:TetR/AcrR family transcriptional regulator [Nocardioides sp. LHD-245]
MTDRADGARRYGGRAAEERVAERRSRLLAAGLESMGTRGVAGTTVRGVAEESGLAARYFYESFASIEELQLAVFEQIAGEAASRSVTALAAAPAEVRARTRAVLVEMVDLFLEDPRKGRIALLESITSPVLGPRVLEESRRFAGMLAATTSSGDPADSPEGLPVELRLTAQFLIGGVAHALGAALQGDIVVERDRLVDVLVDLFLTVNGAGVRP